MIRISIARSTVKSRQIRYVRHASVITVAVDRAVNITYYE